MESTESDSCNSITKKAKCRTHTHSALIHVQASERVRGMAVGWSSVGWCAVAHFFSHFVGCQRFPQRSQTTSLVLSGTQTHLNFEEEREKKRSRVYVYNGEANRRDSQTQMPGCIKCRLQRMASVETAKWKKQWPSSWMVGKFMPLVVAVWTGKSNEWQRVGRVRNENQQ